MDAAAYEKALDDSRTATRIYGEAQHAYRQKKIGDAEFLAARNAFAAAQAEFDRAYDARCAAIDEEAKVARTPTYFQKGDTIQAGLTAQGLTAGTRYRVTGVTIGRFGIVTYGLEGIPNEVANLHLLASLVIA